MYLTQLESAEGFTFSLSFVVGTSDGELFATSSDNVDTRRLLSKVVPELLHLCASETVETLHFGGDEKLFSFGQLTADLEEGVGRHRF